MACRTGCPTQDHESWGACARSADIQIDGHALKVDVRLDRNKDNRLGRYASLRKAGVQPKTTQWKDVRLAEEWGGVRPTPKGKADPAKYAFKREEAA
jgi:hypothetical protein